MGKLTAKAVAFDMYGTVVDVGAVAEACTEVVPDPAAFTTQWRTKQLDYTFLRTLMGKYRDFWAVSEQALEYTARRFHVDLTPEQRRRLMEAWLRPQPYPEVPAALALLKERYPLAILSNGSPRMLRTGLAYSGLTPHFRWVISAHAAKRYKPAPEVYALGPKQMKLAKGHILFVSSNSWDVAGAKSFGFKVCWINRTETPFDPLGPRPDLVVRTFDELRMALV